MKRIFLAVLLLLLTLLAAAIIIPSFIDWGAYKAQIQAQIKSASGVDIAFDGAISLSILPAPHMILQDVSIKSPEGFQNKNFAVLKKLEVYIEPLPLLSGRLAVQSLSLIEPQIFLELNQEKGMNIPEISAGKTADASGEAALVGAGSNAPPSFSLNAIYIKDGVFLYDDMTAKRQEKIENLNAELSAESLDGAFRGEGDFSYNQKDINFNFKTQKADIKSKILPVMAEFSFLRGGVKSNFEGNIHTGAAFSLDGQWSAGVDNLAKLTLDLGGIDNVFSAEPFKIESEIALDSDKVQLRGIEASLGDQKILGSVGVVFSPFDVRAEVKTASNLDLSKILVGFSDLKSGAFNLKMQGNSDVVTLSDAKVTLNDDAFDIAGAYTFNKTRRPELDIKIKTQTLNLDKVTSKESKASHSDSINKNESFVGTAPQIPSFPFDLKVDVSVDNLTLQQRVLRQVQCVAQVQGSKILVSKFKASDDQGGYVDGSFSVQDAQRLTGIELDFAASTKDINKFFANIDKDMAARLPEGLGAGALKFSAKGAQEKLEAQIETSLAGATVDAGGTLIDPFGELKLDGVTARLKHANLDKFLSKILQGKEGNTALQKPLDLAARINLDTDKIYSLQDVKGMFGAATIQGGMNIELSGDKPVIKSNLILGDVVVANAAVKNSQNNVSSGGNDKKTAMASKWSKEPIELSGLNAIDADIDVKAKSFAFGDWRVDNLMTRIILKDGNLTINNLKGRMFDGEIAASASIIAAQQSRQPIQIATRGDFKGVDVGALSQALIGSSVLKISGVVDTAFDLKSSGLSQAALVYDLNGAGSLSGRDITLHGVDVENFAAALSEGSISGDTVMSVWKGFAKGGQTQFETLEGEYSISEGVVTFQKLDLDGQSAAIMSTGKIDLPNWTLATRHKMTAKTVADAPSFEVSLSGSLSNPAQSFGQNLLEGYLKRKVSKKLDKLLGDKLGIALPHDEDEPAAQDQNSAPQNTSPQKQKQKLEAEDVVKDVLKGILR